MVKNQSLTEQLRALLKSKKSKGYYARRLGVSEQKVEKLLDEIKGEKKVEHGEDEDVTIEVDNERGTLKSIMILSYAPKSDKELAELHKVDLTRYKISNYWTKLRSNGKFTSSLLCTLKKPTDFSLAEFSSFLKSYKSDYKPVKQFATDGKLEEEKVDVEISIADAHIDKLTIDNEDTIEDRKEQYLSVLNDLVTKCSSAFKIEKIVFTLGNDLLHTDNIQGTTTSGTPQDRLVSWNRAYEEAFDLMVKAIKTLKSYCKWLDVILIQGNHARTKEYYLAHALAKYFEKDEDILFDREHSRTKFTVLGDTFIGYHHGNSVKLEELPLLFATNPDSSMHFGLSRYREIHTGDKHHLMAKEIKGVRIHQLPSISGTDAWHHDNNFVNNVRAGLALVYHPIKGKVAEFESRIQ